MTISIDVIVRTMANRARANALFRALDSIQDQAGVSARPIVVVNGQRTDGTVLTALAKRPAILLRRIPEASPGRAMAEGRKLVAAPYFGYLDDDDTLVASSLRMPLEWIDTHATCDVLVTNGRFVKANGTSYDSTHIADHINDATMGLLRECWLSPGAFICRTKSMPVSLLDLEWNNLEWTRLAFELCALGKRINFFDIQTVRYNDTPGSTSKQLAQDEASIRLWKWVGNDARFSRATRRGARRNYAHALHDMAWKYSQGGYNRQAWTCHFASLRSLQMLKYLAFTRKLIFPNKRESTADPAGATDGALRKR